MGGVIQLFALFGILCHNSAQRFLRCCHEISAVLFIASDFHGPRRN